MSAVYFQGGAVKDHWKLINNVFKRKNTQFTFIDNNFKRKRNNNEKNAHKMFVCTLRDLPSFFTLSLFGTALAWTLVFSIVNPRGKRWVANSGTYGERTMKALNTDDGLFLTRIKKTQVFDYPSTSIKCVYYVHYCI